MKTTKSLKSLVHYHLHNSQSETLDTKCKACTCNYRGVCIRRDSNSGEVGVCWMKEGQGEY